MLKPTSAKPRRDRLRDGMHKSRIMVFIVALASTMGVVGYSMAEGNYGDASHWYCTGWVYGDQDEEEAEESEDSEPSIAEVTSQYDGNYYQAGTYYPGAENYPNASGNGYYAVYNESTGATSYVPVNNSTAYNAGTGAYRGFLSPTPDDNIVRTSTGQYVNTNTGAYYTPSVSNYPTSYPSYNNVTTYPSTTPTGGAVVRTAPNTANNGYSADQLASLINVGILSPTGTQSGPLVYFEGTTGLSRDERRINMIRPYWIVTGGNLKTPRQFSGVTNSQRFAPGTYNVEFYILDKYNRRYSTTGSFEVVGTGSTGAIVSTADY